ncbi:MAG TPA: adenosine deaminase, partial [Chloroflexota bacterium]|nr:adenosine deaminase [Chloroflexota bacterium]
MSDDLIGLPKAELHLHLEGAIRPATVLALARQHGVALPFGDDEALERALEFGDFLQFLDAFAAVNLCLCTNGDFERITAELVEDLAAQNVLYAELRYSPMRPMQRGLAFDDITAAVVAGAEAGMRLHPETHVELICGLTRQFGADEGLACTRQATRWVGRGIVGLDLGGDEAGHPAELFAQAYRVARDAGLQLTAHAGEAAGPASVRTAVTTLGARRIGHGLRAMEDMGVLALLRAEDVTLEVCPTSNVRTRVVAGYAQHPLRRLHDAGVKVTLSSDDPAMFRTSISQEYAVAEREFGFSRQELWGLTRQAVQAGFCAEP